jgi:RNA methyltransferase, TrmH family
LISKNEIKLILSLKRKKKRDELGLFIIEGEKLVLEALMFNAEFRSIYKLSSLDFKVESVQVKDVTATEMSSISQQITPAPILAVMEMNRHQFEPDKLAFAKILILDAIRDPGNLGTIIRTADWFGIKHIIASNDTVDIYNNKVVQSSMGAVFRTSVYYSDFAIISQLKVRNSDFRVYGAFLKGESSRVLSQANDAGAIMIGNESVGISPQATQFVDTPITIEGNGEMESLNAAISASILLYEWCASPQN